MSFLSGMHAYHIGLPRTIWIASPALAAPDSALACKTLSTSMGPVLVRKYGRGNSQTITQIRDTKEPSCKATGAKYSLPGSAARTDGYWRFRVRVTAQDHIDQARLAARDFQILPPVHALQLSSHKVHHQGRVLGAIEANASLRGLKEDAKAVHKVSKEPDIR